MQTLRREWFDPDRARVPLREYAETWIEQRPGLRPSTSALYRRLLDRYISPKLGSTHLSAIDTAMVRQWRSDLLRAGVSGSMAAKAYRLLRAVLMTAAVEDKMITVNPCQVRGAGVENAQERPVLSVAGVFDLADRMKHPRYRALILLSVFGTLRWGEVSGLRRPDLAPDGRSGNRKLLTGWKEEVVSIGRSGLHFHDLRHTGNTLAAQTYGSTGDLMARMGQDSSRAALIYQHASRQVDQTIADKLSALIEGIGSTVKDPNDGEDDGTSGALVPAG